MLEKYKNQDGGHSDCHVEAFLSDNYFYTYKIEGNFSKKKTFCKDSAICPGYTNWFRENRYLCHGQKKCFFPRGKTE